MTRTTRAYIIKWKNFGKAWHYFLKTEALETARNEIKEARRLNPGTTFRLILNEVETRTKNSVIT